jgi:hypothetical protein
VNWLALITALVAVYGAALSTYTAFVNRQEKQRRVNIRLYYGTLIHGPSVDSNVVVIEISNPRYRSVIVNAPRLKLPDGRTVGFLDPISNVTFPYELREGTSCLVWITAAELSFQLAANGFSGSVKLIGLCRDATGKTYKGKPFKFDME